MEAKIKWLNDNYKELNKNFWCTHRTMSCLNTGLKVQIEVHLCTYFEKVFTYKSTLLKKLRRQYYISSSWMKNVLKYQVSCLNTGLKAHIEVYLCTYFEEVFTYKSTPLKKYYISSSWMKSVLKYQVSIYSQFIYN